MSLTATSNTDIFNPAVIRSYFQASAGNTEKAISVQPVSVAGNIEPAYRYLSNYFIWEFGRGIHAVEGILRVVFKRQFPDPINEKFDLWHRVVAVSVRCNLVATKTKISFQESTPDSLEAIDPVFAATEGEDRRADIHDYLCQLKRGETIRESLFISGDILNYLGAKTDSKSLYMLDGARRLSAQALFHQGQTDIVLLMFEEEYSALLENAKVQALKEKIREIHWFENYHTLPLIGIQGQRTLRRFDLMDLNVLQDKTVIDFGCNIGQASFKAFQAGAKQVLGLDGMPDTLSVANEIREFLGFRGVQFQEVDFNEPYFDKKIDRLFPGKTDYSFFFSLYRTKELVQREQLFKYIIQKTRKGIFFEGHAHPEIDTVAYYDWLFDCFGLCYQFFGFSEENTRPLFYLDLEKNG